MLGSSISYRAIRSAKGLSKAGKQGVKTIKKTSNAIKNKIKNAQEKISETAQKVKNFTEDKLSKAAIKDKLDHVEDKLNHAGKVFKVRTTKLKSKITKLDDEEISSTNKKRLDIAKRYVEKIRKKMPNTKTLFEMPPLQEFMEKESNIIDSLKNFPKITSSDIRGNKELFTKTILELKGKNGNELKDFMSKGFSENALKYIASAFKPSDDNKMIGFKQSIIQHVFQSTEAKVMLVNITNAINSKKNEKLEAKKENASIAEKLLNNLGTSLDKASNFLHTKANQQKNIRIEKLTKAQNQSVPLNENVSVNAERLNQYLQDQALLDKTEKRSEIGNDTGVSQSER